MNKLFIGLKEDNTRLAEELKRLGDENFEYKGANGELKDTIKH